MILCVLDIRRSQYLRQLLRLPRIPGEEAFSPQFYQFSRIATRQLLRKLSPPLPPVLAWYKYTMISHVHDAWNVLYVVRGLLVYNVPPMLISVQLVWCNLKGIVWRYPLWLWRSMIRLPWLLIKCSDEVSHATLHDIHHVIVRLPKAISAEDFAAMRKPYHSRSTPVVMATAGNESDARDSAVAASSADSSKNTHGISHT